MHPAIGSDPFSPYQSLPSDANLNGNDDVTESHSTGGNEKSNSLPTVTVLPQMPLPQISPASKHAPIFALKFGFAGDATETRSSSHQREMPMTQEGSSSLGAGVADSLPGTAASSATLTKLSPIQEGEGEGEVELLNEETPRQQLSTAQLFESDKRTVSAASVKPSELLSATVGRFDTLMYLYEQGEKIENSTALCFALWQCVMHYAHAREALVSLVRSQRMLELLSRCFYRWRQRPIPDGLHTMIAGHKYHIQRWKALSFGGMRELGKVRPIKREIPREAKVKLLRYAPRMQLAQLAFIETVKCRLQVEALLCIRRNHHIWEVAAQHLEAEYARCVENDRYAYLPKRQRAWKDVHRHWLLELQSRQKQAEDEIGAVLVQRSTWIMERAKRACQVARSHFRQRIGGCWENPWICMKIAAWAFNAQTGLLRLDFERLCPTESHRWHSPLTKAYSFPHNDVGYERLRHAIDYIRNQAGDDHKVSVSVTERLTKLCVPTHPSETAERYWRRVCGKYFWKLDQDKYDFGPGDGTIPNVE